MVESPHPWRVSIPKVFEKFTAMQDKNSRDD